MVISFKSNINSLRVQANINKASSQLSTTFQRLSSGIRFANPSDDTAGRAVADILHADVRKITIALRNSNDGVSLLSTAEAAQGAIGNVLRRMLELAQQASNETFSTAQRSSLQIEFSALGSEVERIATAVTFNSVRILSNSLAAFQIQAGIQGGRDHLIQISGFGGRLESLGLAALGTAVLSFSLIANSVAGSLVAARSSIDAVYRALLTLGFFQAEVGASESRLGKAIDNLAVARENYVAAESRIRDIDTAEETSKYVRQQILLQAGTALLAQANQSPTVALALLSDSLGTSKKGSDQT
jgi:flagellin